MGERAAKTVLFEQLARVSKALASGKRLELLDLLAQRGSYLIHWRGQTSSRRLLA